MNTENEFLDIADAIQENEFAYSDVREHILSALRNLYIYGDPRSARKALKLAIVELEE